MKTEKVSRSQLGSRREKTLLYKKKVAMRRIALLLTFMSRVNADIVSCKTVKSLYRKANCCSPDSNADVVLPCAQPPEYTIMGFDAQALSKTLSFIVGREDFIEAHYKNPRLEGSHPFWTQLMGPEAVRYHRRISGIGDDVVGGAFLNDSIVSPNAEPAIDVASIQKSVLAIALMKAVEMNLFALSDTVASILGQGWESYELTGQSDVPASHSNAVTVYHLATMTSGLKTSLGSNWSPVLCTNRSDANTCLSNSASFRPPDSIAPETYTFKSVSISRIANPGEVFSYDNRVYSMIIRIIQKTSGINIDEFCGTHIFSPLGMQNTRWAFRGNYWVPYAQTRPWYDTDNPFALVTNAPDLYRLMDVYVKNGNNIINQSSLDNILTVHANTSDGNAKYGLLTWIYFDSNGERLPYESAAGALKLAYAFNRQSQTKVVHLGDNSDTIRISTIPSLLK